MEKRFSTNYNGYRYNVKPTENPGVVYYSASRRLPGIAYRDGITYEDEMSQQSSGRSAQIAQTPVASSDFEWRADADPVWDMMLRGTSTLQGNMKRAILNKDRDAFNKEMSVWKEYTENHLDDISTVMYIADNSGTPEGKALADVCRSWSSGEVWSKIPGATEFADNNSPEALARSAKNASESYGMGDFSSKAYTDETNSWYHAFDSLRGGVTKADTIMKTRPDVGFVASNEAKARVRRAARLLDDEKYRSNFSNASEADSFFGSVFERFGDTVSDMNLGELSRYWGVSKSRNPELDVDSFVKSWADRRTASRPMRKEKGVDTGSPDPLVHGFEVAAGYDAFAKKCFDSGITLDPTVTSTSDGLRTAYEQVGRLRKHVTMPGDWNSAAPNKAFYSLTGKGDPDTRLDQAETCLRQAFLTSGATYDTKTGEAKPHEDDNNLSLYNGVLPKAITEEFMKSGKNILDFTKSLSDHGPNGSYQQVLKAASNTLGRMIPNMSESLRTELSERFISNFVAGKSESLFRMVRTLGHLDDWKSEELRNTGTTVVDPKYSMLNIGSETSDLEKRGEILAAKNSLRQVASGESPMLRKILDDGDRAAIMSLANSVSSVGSADRRLPSQRDYDAGGRIALYNLDTDMNLGNSLPENVRSWIRTGDMFRFLGGSDKAFGSTQGEPRDIEAAVSVAESMSRVVRDTKVPVETRAKVAGLLIPVLASIPNRGGWLTSAPLVMDATEQLTEEATGRKLYNTHDPSGVYSPTTGSVAVRSIGKIPVNLSDSEASKFAGDLKVGLESILGVTIPDMTTVGLPKVEIGKKTTFDMNPILSVALSGLDQKVAEDKIIEEDRAAQNAKIESNDDPREVNSERPGADARLWLASVMSPDARSSLIADQYIRKLKSTAYADDDNLVKSLAQKRRSEIDKICLETSDFETAYRMCRPFLEDRVVYRKDNVTGGNIIPSIMQPSVYNAYKKTLMKERGLKDDIPDSTLDAENIQNASDYYMFRRVTESLMKRPQNSD